MASELTQPATAATNMTLTPVMTLESHEDSSWIWSMAYFPDGKRMISVFVDQTMRRWDLQTGKEIEGVRDVCDGNLYIVVVSRDGRWVITSGEERKELKAYEVETGIVKTFQDSRMIRCIDISADSKLLASGSMDTVLIWGMDTGKVVAGPFESGDNVGTVRFSPDSKKLAVESQVGKCLEVWDVQRQKLDARVGKEFCGGIIAFARMFWANKGTILAVFNFDFDDDDSKLTTIYEFDASTLETVGEPFEGHTKNIRELVLSFDGTLVASASFDNTIKLWGFESRQLLASFHFQHELRLSNLIFSPDTRQLAYSVYNKIFVCNTPPDILAGIRLLAPDAQGRDSAPEGSKLHDLLNSDSPRRLANVRRNPATSPMIYLPPRPLQPLPTRGIQPRFFFLQRLRNLLPFYSHINVVPPVENGQPRDPLDIPATSSRINDHIPVAHTTRVHSHSDLYEHSRHTTALPTTLESATASATLETRIQFLSRWWPVHTSHQASPIVDVPLAQGQLRNAAAGAPKNDEDLIPDEYFDISSQNPDSQQPSAAARIDTGEHGHGGSCFCF